MRDDQTTPVEGAARRYLEAVAHDDDPRPHCSGWLRFYWECNLEARPADPPGRLEVSIEKLDLKSVEERSATVDVVASRRVTVDFLGEPFTFSRSYDGIMQLVFEDDEWRVADHGRDGSPILGSFVLQADTAVRAGPFDVTPLLLDHRSDEMSVYFSVASSVRAWGWECWGRSRARTHQGNLFKASELVPGERYVLGGSLPRPKRLPDELRLVVPLFDRDARRWRRATCAVTTRTGA